MRLDTELMCQISSAAKVEKVRCPVPREAVGSRLHRAVSQQLVSFDNAAEEKKKRVQTQSTSRA